ncbi:unnamed protein product, partial [Mesorhabditis belari]|uniref:Hexosyltransferase n=1 Tax=Mesorhabditis belari TaxID=2138241 RepID=A0AAF3EDW8_9BILA
MLFWPRNEHPFQRIDDIHQIDLAFRFRQSKNHELCEANTTLFIGIISRPSEFDLRSMVRESWAKRGQTYDRNFTRVEFFVGEPKDFEERRLEEEMFTHRDISILNMNEDYYALPQKTLALLLYKEQRCPKVKCLIKSDSDNVLNVRLFEKLCNETAGGERKIFGNCSVKRKVQRHGKWRIPRWLIPQREYPQYCSTGIYMFTGNRTVNHLLHEVSISEYARSANFRKLPEDVLFSGIFPEKANISRITLSGFSFNSSVVSDCSNCSPAIYSLHMTDQRKDPIEHFQRILEFSNRNCSAVQNFTLNLADF